MKKLFILMVLLLASWTLSSAQTGSDTTRTYTRTELKKIAKKIARANYCDSMLVYANEQLRLDSLKLVSKDKEIHNFTRINVQNDSIQKGLNDKIKEYKNKEKSSSKANKRLKTGSAVLVVLVFIENVWLALKKEN